MGYYYHNIHSYSISWDSIRNTYESNRGNEEMNIQIGKIYKVKKGSEGKCWVYNENNDKFIKITKIDEKLYYDILDKDKKKIVGCDCFTPDDLEPVKKTLDTLEVGDIVEDENGKRKVLGVCGEVYFMSRQDDFDPYSLGFTAKQLKDDGFKVVGQEEDTEVTEAIALLEREGYEVKKK